MTWVCIASGPSLTDEDIEAVRLSGLPTVAVNSTWERVRFASVIYAGDNSWLKVHLDRIDIPAEVWSCSPMAYRHGVNKHSTGGGAYNSGLRAVQWAAARTKRIILLGYDAQLTDGKTHHHGDHGEGLRNPTASSCRSWQGQFRSWARKAQQRGVTVWNCSRETALDCFPRMTLEAALESVCA